jgi:predicted ATPase with chaperone activity
VRRVARTIADLAGREEILPDDIDQATWMREDLW